MKIPCEYCGQMIPETAQTCPHCGAANSKVKRTAYGVPTTIEELRAYCQRHNLPLQDMRVFLGEDYRARKPSVFTGTRPPEILSFIKIRQTAAARSAMRAMTRLTRSTSFT